MKKSLEDHLSSVEKGIQSVIAREKLLSLELTLLTNRLEYLTTLYTTEMRPMQRSAFLERILSYEGLTQTGVAFVAMSLALVALDSLTFALASGCFGIILICWGVARVLLLHWLKYDVKLEFEAGRRDRDKFYDETKKAIGRMKKEAQELSEAIQADGTRGHR